MICKISVNSATPVACNIQYFLDSFWREHSAKRAGNALGRAVGKAIQKAGAKLVLNTAFLQAFGWPADLTTLPSDVFFVTIAITVSTSRIIGEF